MILFWILFNVFVVAMLVLDLGVFHRNTHKVKFREAMLGVSSGSVWPEPSRWWCISGTGAARRWNLLPAT